MLFTHQLILSYLLWFSLLGLRSFDRQAEAISFIGHFIDEMNIYGSSYDSRTRFDLEQELLISSEAILASELPGLEEEQILARTYFRILKEQKIQIAYSNTYEMVSCKGLAYGTIVSKTVTMPDQSTYVYQDFIELIDKGNKGFRVKAIYSNRFSSFSTLECKTEQTKKPPEGLQIEEPSCSFFAEAELAYRQEQYAQALLYYEQSIGCQGKDAYIKEQISNLTTANSIHQLLKQAQAAFNMAKFQRAIQLYRSALNYDLSVINIDRSHVQNQIEQCEQEVSYLDKVDRGNYYYQRGYFNKALPLFINAVSLKSDTDIASKIIHCREQISQEYQQEMSAKIAKARGLIKSRNSYKEALITLMNYDDSDLIDGELFFYMAMVMDACYAKVKKTYDLKGIDCCVLAKRYLIKARNLGYQSKDLDIFWKEHFNNRSRTCKK